MDPPVSHSRRQFLTGEAALDALGQAGPPLVPTLPTPEAEPETASQSGRTYLVQVGRRAMACQFEILLNAGEQSDATERATEAIDLIDRLESQLSVYRADSEVSLLNREAARQPMPVEARLFELLRRAVELHAATDGAFDITAGPLIKAWGFFRRQGQIPSEPALREAMDCVGSQWLALDDSQRTIGFRKPGLEINLGAIGKGHALDRSAELLTAAGVNHFMIHGGSSSILARGRRAGRHTTGWTVGIRHPLRPERRLAEVVLQGQGLGTSGAGTQHFYHRGQRYGHILDPRSGQPAAGVWSATVVAPDAATADALSTAFYVLGPEPAREFCAGHPDVGALITCPGRQAGTVDLHVVGLADSQWRRLSD